MTRVKICGITNIEDALNAVELGADALGFVFAPSPRQIETNKAEKIIEKLPPWISIVGVFVNEKQERILQIAGECGLDWIQLHGEESPEYCRELNFKKIKVFKNHIENIPEYKVQGVLIDSFDVEKRGGTGKVSDWGIAKEAKSFGKPIILSGGLTPENVATAIEIVKPYGVDVSTGVEKSPGKKDYEKMKSFFREVKKYAP